MQDISSFDRRTLLRLAGALAVAGTVGVATSQTAKAASGSIEAMQSVCDKLNASRQGYCQTHRFSFLNKSKRSITAAKECDCSSSSAAIAWLAGYPVKLVASGTEIYTGNFKARLQSAGFAAIKFKNLDQVKPGDFVLGPGHVVFARSSKQWWSAEHNERGTATGGKPGNQGGREFVGYRKPYKRSRGWDWILRPPAPPKDCTKSVPKCV